MRWLFHGAHHQAAIAPGASFFAQLISPSHSFSFAFSILWIFSSDYSMFRLDCFMCLSASVPQPQYRSLNIVAKIYCFSIKSCVVFWYARTFTQCGWVHTGTHHSHGCGWSERIEKGFWDAWILRDCHIPTQPSPSSTSSSSLQPHPGGGVDGYTLLT